MSKSSTGTKGRRTKVEALKHKDKRVNIPTEELRDFVADEEKASKTILYPRDTSLDPQLVWKGKDEQDAHPLEVPVVPIYIQEKIHPQAIIEDLREHGGSSAEEPQIAMFADFNGGPKEFEKRVDFYHWPQNWANRMILGDSLMVMTSLAEKEGLKGKVQMIYIDPPYGIRFGSNWQVSTRKRDVRDGKTEDVNREPEVVKAFRDTWEKGIHSYLAYLRDRLRLSHDLLTESGSIFVQIGDQNVHLVRSLLDEVFGSKNFVSLITLKKMGGLAAEFIAGASDYIVWFAKDRYEAKYRQLYLPKIAGEGQGTGARYDGIISSFGERRRIPQSEDELQALQEQGWRIYQPSTLTTFGSGGSSFFEFDFQGRGYLPTDSKGWLTTAKGLNRLSTSGRVVPTGNSVRYVRCLADFAAYQINNVWTDIASPPDVVYVVQTSTKAIERCLLMTTDPGDLVFDPTCGSGTTAAVAEQWGRRWITTDTSRVALALARTRLMAARFPYYMLADSPEGIAKEAEITGRPPSQLPTEGDVRRGFVYKRVPHITLRSIANNEEIDSIRARYQEQIETVLKQLNRAIRQKFEDWQVPRVAEAGWSIEAKTLLEQWWKLRGQRQAEIDASIQQRADSELLYDQPYEDSKRVRVTGPFTVESLSPHRVLQATEEPSSEATARRATGDQFVAMILDNLKKAGVQNTVKRERLKFDQLDPYPGVYLQAAGEYTENDKRRRAAVCVGPEYGTVGPDLLKEAAKEAVLGVGFDLLLVCGFAFDPHVSEEALRYGKLVVLITRMNPDLAMGDELLKKTGAGNLFMIFGEPDVSIKPQKDGTLVVEIKGVDVYDPTTGQIRSNATDDIACWFLDTDYNGESFFVRHAYFTGANEPYEKLKKALRAEIDEAAWSSLYSTVSRPFPAPKGNGKKPGKIAIKVINHYGDEVMKVYDLGAKSRGVSR